MRREEKPLRTSVKGSLNLKKKKKERKKERKENIVPLLLDVLKSEKMIPGDEIWRRMERCWPLTVLFSL